MTNRRKLNPGGVILSSQRMPEATPIRIGESIETLEALRDTVQAQEWVDIRAKHSVLYGIKMAIHSLKQKQPNEAAE